MSSQGQPPSQFQRGQSPQPAEPPLPPEKEGFLQEEIPPQAMVEAIGEKISSVAHTVAEKTVEVKDRMAEGLSNVGHAIADKATQLKHKAEDIGHNILGKASDTYEAGKDKIVHTYQSGKEGATDVLEASKEKLGAAYEASKEKAVEWKDKAAEVFGAGKESAEETMEAAKDKAAETYEKSKEKMSEMGAAGKEKLQAGKENIGQKLEAGKEKWEAGKEKIGEKLESAKEKAAHALDTEADRASKLYQSAKEKFTAGIGEGTKEKGVDFRTQAQHGAYQAVEAAKDTIPSAEDEARWKAENLGHDRFEHAGRAYWVEKEHPEILKRPVADPNRPGSAASTETGEAPKSLEQELKH